MHISIIIIIRLQKRPSIKNNFYIEHLKHMSLQQTSPSNQSSDEEYQLMEEIPHILSRPDTYLGENVLDNKKMFTYDPTTNTVSFEKIQYSTGLLKIFDEILINAVDNVQRNVGTSYIKVNITSSTISIENDGKSIPIKYFPNTDKYIPEILFTRLRSGSNFNDNQERTTGGRNGLGCKITTIFSTHFEIFIVNDNKSYHQIITNNDTQISPPTITPLDQTTPDVVKITFTPDLPRFNLSSITKHMQLIMYKRIHDISYLPLEIYINNQRIPRHTWDSFVQSYNICDFMTYIYIDPTNKSRIWRIAFGLSSEMAKTISFVNYIATYEGGTHVNYIANQIADPLAKSIEKFIPSSKEQVRTKLSLIISAIIVNPTFSSQAKEKLTLSATKFGSTCIIPPSLIKTFIDTNKDTIKKMLSIKYIKQINSKQIKKTKVTNIERLVDANKAGSQEGYKCTLFICEGLSAKTMVDAGMCIIGHDYYGCFPLQGKILNTRKESLKKYTDSQILTDLKSAIGLIDGTEYISTKSLRYGKIVCVKDADSDGADIMGLVMNFFDDKFPSLLQIDGFFSEFISPMIQIIKTNKNKQITKIPFYNEVEYKQFINKISNDPSFGSFTVKFIKGLATNEDDDIKEYFNHYSDNCIKVIFDDDYQLNMDIGFHKDLADVRKDWISTLTEETHLPRIKGQPITCSDFINNDLLMFSMDSCIRAIPSVVDGLKPSQRKILYTLLRMPLTKSRKQMKVFQLGGIVAKQSNYHHGDASLNGAIIKMAQDFAGSNNIPLLERSGQFGSRQECGDDAGQPRYVSCCLAEITRYIFPSEDDDILTYRLEDNQSVEPNFYVPIIPMLLINGANGIGTGWSTLIPSYNPWDIIEYVKLLLSKSMKNNIRFIDGKFKAKIDNFKIHSFYNGFIGDIVEEDNKIWYNGLVDIYYSEDICYKNNVSNSNCLHKSKSCDEFIIDILEIPVFIKIISLNQLLNSLMISEDEKTSNDNKRRSSNKTTNKTTTSRGKTSIKSSRVTTSDEPTIIRSNNLRTSRTNNIRISTINSNIPIVKSFTNNNNKDANSVNYQIVLNNPLTKESIMNIFKLKKSISTRNMTAFNGENLITRYEDIYDIISDWYFIRHDYYELRIEHQIDETNKLLTKISNKARFIKENIDEVINIRKKPRKEVESLLEERKYDKIDDKYDYLLEMPMYWLTKEKYEQLLKELNDITQKLEYLMNTTVEIEWLNDLNKLSDFMTKHKVCIDKSD